MSYDYLLVKAPDSGSEPPSGEDLEAVLMAFADAFAGDPIGSVDDVKASLAALYPSLRWQQQKFELPPHMLVAELGDWSWSTVSQEGVPAFGLGADGEGQVRMISASRLERAEVERAARALGLMVLDEQTLEILSG